MEVKSIFLYNITFIRKKLWLYITPISVRNTLTYITKIKFSQSILYQLKNVNRLAVKLYSGQV